MTDISLNGEARFSFDSFSSSWLSASTTMDHFWESDDNKLLISPISVNEVDEIVEVSIGVPSSTLTNKNTVALPRGSSSDLVVYSQSGNQILANDLDFIFNQNETKLNNLWASQEASGSDLAIQFSANEEEGISNYNGWLRLFDDGIYYVKQIEVAIKPYHKLKYSREAKIIKEEELTDANGNILDPVRGMPFKIQGYLDNVGEFYEEVILYNEVSNSDRSYIRYDHLEFNVLPGDSVFYQFDWNTTGLPAGQYLSKVVALHNNVDNLTILNESLSASYNINLIDPPPFNLDLNLDKNSYKRGDTILIRSTAERLGQTLTDAKLTAKIEHPDGRFESLTMPYNANTGNYEAETKANIGGNYYIEVYAERKYYIPQIANDIAKVQVDITPVFSDEPTRLFENKIVEIQSTPVGGVQGFAMDLTSSSTVLEFDDFIASDEWLNPSVQISKNGNNAIVGLTNLGDENSLSNFNTFSLGLIVYQASSEGSYVGSFTNFSLIDKRGEPMHTNVTSNISSNVLKQEAYLSLINSSKNSVAGITDTLEVVISNSYQVFASNIQLSFDQESVEVLEILEGSALSGFQTDSTLFVKNINHTIGNLSMGITRTNTNKALEIGSGVVGKIIYKPLKEAVSNFVFEKGDILTPVDNIALPVITTDKTLSISPLPDSLKKVIRLQDVTDTTSEGYYAKVGITTSNVDNISSFATSLVYDTTFVEFESIQKGNYFGDSSSLLYENNPDSGNVTIGVSNLDYTTQTISESDTLIIATFRFKNAGEANFRLNRTGLFDEVGNQIDLAVQDSIFINNNMTFPESDVLPEIKFKPNIVFSNEQNEFTISIAIDSVENVNSFAGDLIYNPSILSFQNATEGDFFDEGGTAQTSFVTYNDEQNGILTLGLSRLGEDIGVSTKDDKIFANITFKQIGIDSSFINLSNTGLLLPDGESRISHVTSRVKVGQMGDGFVVTPQIISPNNNVIPVGDVTFNWQDSEFNDNYLIQISDTSNYSNILTDTTIASNSYTTQILDIDTFYWRLKSRNDYGESEWVFASFTTDSSDTPVEKLKVVDLIYPSDGDSLVALDAIFEWSKSDSANQYLIELAEDVNFNKVVIDSLTADTTVNLSNVINYSTEYFWRVKALNESNESDFTQAMFFKTLPQKPSIVILLSPENKSVLEISDPTFIWQLSERADNYLFQLSTDSLFNEINIDTLIFTNELVLNQNLDLDLNYYWRVKSSNSGGSSNWSDIWNFTVSVATSNEGEASIPNNYTLKQNYPNPFNPSTNIRFGLPHTGNARVEVFDMLGKKVYDTGNKNFSAGYHNIRIDFSNRSSGVYLYRLVTDETQIIKKMVFLK